MPQTHTTILALMLAMGALPASQAGARQASPSMTSLAFTLSSLGMQSSADHERLLDLAAPVALLPDPLLAQVLAASNYPSQINRIRNFMNSQGLMSGARQLSWPASVVVLTQAPAFFNNIATHREWLQGLNTALRNQPGNLFTAVQILRSKAVRSGALAQVPQLRVINVRGTIQIEPSDPSSIPIPSYTPSVVFQEEAPVGAIGIAGSIPTSSITQPLEINWATGELVNGWGGWCQGQIGRDRAGNISASGTTFVLGSRPGYDGAVWRPSGTVVFPGSVSTQGSPLEITPWIPPVSPTAPLMPAAPVEPVRPAAPASRVAPHAPVQPASVVRPVRPVQPVAPIPSNIPGVYAPVPFGFDPVAQGWAYGGGTVFGASGGWQASSRGAASTGGRSR